jgi:hypothetical protein
MQELTTHFKSGTKLVGTSGPNNPRLNNYGRQLIGIFCPMVMIWVTMWIQDLLFRTTTMKTTCNNLKTTSIRNNNGWSNLPFLFEQNGIVMIIFSVIQIPHVLDESIPVFINMWQKNPQ